MNDRRKNLSLAEIGRRFHVSAATVSNILNNKGKFSSELAGKILAFVDEVEYRPSLLAQSLKGNSKIVGFCLRGNLEDPWYIRVMAEVQNGLRRHGFYVGTVLGEHAGEVGARVGRQSVDAGRAGVHEAAGLGPGDEQGYVGQPRDPGERGSVEGARDADFGPRGRGTGLRRDRHGTSARA